MLSLSLEQLMIRHRVLTSLWPALAGTALSACALAMPIRDDTAATLRLSAPAQRIVSLSPGTTEMLFAAGAGDRIVATVTGADVPDAAKKIPRIGEANGLVFDRLIALKPDAVVVWKDLTNELVLDSLVNKLKLNVYFVSIRRLEDIPQSVRRLGVLAGTSATADDAAKTLEAQLAHLPTRAGVAKSARRPVDVFFMFLDSPLYTVGSRSAMADAITRCGGRNLYDDIDFPMPIVEFKDLKKRNPDLILMSAPPITAREWRERWAPFTDVKAVANRQLVAYPDQRLVRMGPSAIDAVPELCKLIDGARR